MTAEAWRQPPPNSLQVEFTEGCNLRCGFCGLQGIRAPGEKNLKFMTLGVAEHLALAVAHSKGWRPRVEFAMHGEPTLNPTHVDIVSIFRTVLPKASLMMTTNGGGLLGGPGPAANVMLLFEAGLNTLALDDYQGVRIVEKVVCAIEDEERGVILEVEEGDNPRRGIRYALDRWPDLPFWLHRYPGGGPHGNPHKRQSHMARRITLIEAIDEATAGTHSLLCNHTGAAFPLNDKRQDQRCALPFRELSVRWDGSVALCCNDWRGRYKIGNILDCPAEQGLDHIWQHDAFQAARRKLYQGDRNFGVCRGCDYRTYRNGLLPDKTGQRELRPPDANDDSIIGQAMAGNPFTLPVLRPWEREGGNGDAAPSE